MDVKELQAALNSTGLVALAVDGIFGPRTRQAVLDVLEDGPDTPLTGRDFARGAELLRCSPAAIRAVWEVEAAGAGFQAGLPKLLPEPHRFSRLTRGRFDRSHPDISYPVWGARPYPRSQADRYDVLLRMVALDVDAGFMACSWGAPQILGEHWQVLGYASPWDMARAFSRDEEHQLQAFCQFIRANARLLSAIRSKDWASFARWYNGPAYRQNRYDEKLAAAYERNLAIS